VPIKKCYTNLVALSEIKYQRASVYFANIDLLMGSIKRFQEWGLINVSSSLGPRFQKINMFYSSPEYYTKSKHQSTKLSKETPDDLSLQSVQSTYRRRTLETSDGIQWAVKKDDFFPYSDCPHCFWTGFFTSRTAFKRLERVASSFLLAARQIETFPAKNDSFLECTGWHDDCGTPLFELEDALGVAQHHDAVSGTAKQVGSVRSK